MFRYDDKTASFAKQIKYGVAKDYRNAFHKEPPAKAIIAGMIDSDNTGKAARACIDFIRIFR